MRLILHLGGPCRACRHAAANRDQAQRRAAQDHRQPGGSGAVQECRLRGIFLDARRQLALWGKMIRDANIQLD
jgi:hypothetical protein